MDVHYKPGMTLDEPIAVVMAAADWITLMNWFTMKNTEGVNHLIYGRISQQLLEKCYDQSSIKAAKARIAEHEEENDPLNFLRRLGVPIGHVHLGPEGPEFIDGGVPKPEDFGYGGGHPRDTCNCTCPESMGPICNGECHA